jgi:DNA-binding PadR family transcriptional regulator
VRGNPAYLIPIEVSILEASAALRRSGDAEVHGYELAKLVQEHRGASRLTSYGTLYKALTSLEREGYLASRWEEADPTAADGRPRRRFYRLTLDGAGALIDRREAGQTSSTHQSAARTVP